MIRDRHAASAPYYEAHPFSLTSESRGPNAGDSRLDVSPSVCLPDPFDPDTCIPPRLPDYLVLEGSAGARPFGLPVRGGLTARVTRYGDAFVGPRSVSAYLELAAS